MTPVPEQISPTIRSKNLENSSVAWYFGRTDKLLCPVVQRNGISASHSSFCCISPGAQLCNTRKQHDAIETDLFIRKTALLPPTARYTQF